MHRSATFRHPAWKGLSRNRRASSAHCPETIKVRLRGMKMTEQPHLVPAAALPAPRFSRFPAVFTPRQA